MERYCTWLTENYASITKNKEYEYKERRKMKRTHFQQNISTPTTLSMQRYIQSLENGHFPYKQVYPNRTAQGLQVESK